MATVTPCTQIRDVLLVQPDLFADERGLFVETYRRSWFPGGREMVQANRADRRAGSIVGLHYHLHQADYWYVPVGRARVVLHDLREGSATDGVTWSVDMGANTDGTNDHCGLYIPPGVAHGFAALTDVVISYLVDGYYNPADELGLAWDDPAVAADWGLTDPILSQRDQDNPRRDELSPTRRPHAALRT